MSQLERRMIRPERDCLEEAIHAVEASTGGMARFHDHTGQIETLLGNGRISHAHAVCLRIKAVDSARCTAVDLGACAAHARRSPRGFWKSCHGGLVEACVPLLHADRALGTLFLGPWRDTGGAELADPGARHRLAASARDLPALPAGERERVLGLARLLARAVVAAAAPLPAHHEDRRARIARLVDTYACEGLELESLAADLGLSPARTGVVVHRLFGCTFPQLLNNTRLTRARQLLATTRLTVTEIAARCGFADAAHLHRRFRAAEGCTPAAWRRNAAG
jgi:AraC-like DNA-binding protein